MFRPPSLLAPLIVPTAANTAAGQLGLLRPGLSCFVASARSGYANRPKTGNWRYGDLHPARLSALSAAPVTPLRRYYGPVRHLLAFDRLPGLAGYTIIPCSGDFAPGRERLHQLLGVSLSPCCRFHPAEVGMPHRSDFGTPCCLRPTEAGSALGSRPFEATFAFTVVTAR
jgi:hypothetical protein